MLRVLTISVALLAAIVNAQTQNCGRNCGGCKPGRCDVFGCSGGGYCCLDLNQYGSCCSSCGDSPPSPPGTPAPSGSTKCPAGMYTGKAWFPWSHPKPCGKETWAMWGCKKVFNKIANKALLGRVCSARVSPWYLERCMAEEAAGDEELPMFGPEAIAAGLGVEFIGCELKGMVVAKICSKITGKITGDVLGRMENDACGAFSDLLHPDTWLTSVSSTAGVSFLGRRDLKPVVTRTTPAGFPKAFEADVNVTVNGTAMIQARIAYANYPGIFYQKIRALQSGQSYTLKRTIPTGTGTSNDLGCGVWWNATNCRASYSEEAGLRPGAQLPDNFLDFYLHQVLNVSAPVAFVANQTCSGGVACARYDAPQGSLPAGILLSYFEALTTSPPTPLGVQLTLADTGKLYHVITFSNVVPSVNSANWALPSHCPLQETGVCQFTCQGYGWTACPNATTNASYGVRPQPGSKFAPCMAALDVSTGGMCPAEYPYCMDTTLGGGECSTVPYLCANVTSGKPYMCGAGYPCCDYANRNCQVGPCSNATPPATVSPPGQDSSASGDATALPPTTTPPPFTATPVPDTCSQHLTCSGCIADPLCGWNNEGNDCRMNTSSFSCSGTCANCRATICPSPGLLCSQYIDCAQCAADPACGWSESTRSCTPGDAKGSCWSSRNGECSGAASNTPGGFSWMYGANASCPRGATTCSEYLTCFQCTHDPACGWNYESNACSSGNTYGSCHDTATCSGTASANFSWQYGAFAVCRLPVPCSSHLSCDSCTNDTACGWSIPDQECSPGDSTGSCWVSHDDRCDNPSGGSNSYGWVFGPAGLCPAHGLPCSQYGTCAECTKDLACGWNYETGSQGGCVPGTATYACRDSDQCSGPSGTNFTYQYGPNAVCPTTHCSDALSCAACVAQPACGWNGDACAPGTAAGACWESWSGNVWYFGTCQ